MAKLIPPYIDKSCKSNGERMIFEMLKNEPFAENWIVLHSLNVAQHATRLYGEIDFLLLIPHAGIFVMEVKGGDVRCNGGVWEFRDKFGNVYKNKSPFNQARDAMFSLAGSVKKKYGLYHKFSRIQFGFFVAFPQVNFDVESVEYEQWQIFDKATYHSNRNAFFTTLIHKFSDKHRSEAWFSKSESLPVKTTLEEVCQIFRPDFERIRTAKDRLFEFDKQVKTYTEEQFRVLDSIQLNDRSLIQGGAGTGKTMISIESAIRSASEGKKVFLTCYNRIIGEWMQNQLEEWKDLITVSSLHSYLFEKSKGFDYDRNQLSSHDFYAKYLPTLLTKMYETGIGEKFDKLIIDEGQDLIREEYLNLFSSMLKGGLANGIWEIYGDFESQAIFSQRSKQEMLGLLQSLGSYSNFLLRINCRNTKQIGNEISLLSGFSRPPFRLEYLEADPVSYHFYKGEDSQITILKKILERHQSLGTPSKEIAVLSGKRFSNSCVGQCFEFPIRELKTALDRESSDSIAFATIQSYKGMECNHIIITDVEDVSSEMAKSLLYVGMSRAKYHLTMLISESERDRYYEILRNKLTP